MSRRAVLWCAVSSQAQADEDKDSLAIQEQQGIAFCRAENLDLIATLIVPGHSRYYIDIHDVAREMLEKGIDAFSRLIALWDKKAFDVLIVRDGDRFGRTQTLHSYVVERTISIGAKIYSFHDGWIDEKQAPMFIAMSGYKTKMDMTRLLEYKANGMPKRIAKGLHANVAPSTHKTVRDQSGKAVKLVFDETQRQYWDDVATILLQGIGWNALNPVLTVQFGYPSTRFAFWRLFHNPYFWGHSAENYCSQRGDWAYEDILPPQGVIIHRHTHEPVYSGDLGERVKAELRRRKLMKGNRRPQTTTRFSGLIKCDYCHTSAIAFMPRKQNVNHSYRCNAKTYGVECPSHKSISDKDIQHYFDLYLQEFDKRAIHPGPIENTDEDRIQRLQKEQADLEKKVGQLINDKAEAPTDNIRAMYSQKISEVGERLDKIETQIRALSARIESPAIYFDRQMAFKELLAMQREAFWQQPSTSINQLLHRIMGRRRLLLRDGEIVGILE